MRPKYKTRAIVLARHSHGEANLLITLLTEDLGLVRARAQGVRYTRAKLAAALTTLAESELQLVRGAEGWRIAGATLIENHFLPMPRAARVRAARVIGLYTRLISGEVVEPRLFHALTGHLRTFATLPEEEYEALEVLGALELLSTLGLDAGTLPDSSEEVGRNRREYVARVNRGIEASGL